MIASRVGPRYRHSIGRPLFDRSTAADHKLPERSIHVAARVGQPEVFDRRIGPDSTRGQWKHAPDGLAEARAANAASLAFSSAANSVSYGLSDVIHPAELAMALTSVGPPKSNSSPPAMLSSILRVIVTA